MKVSRACPHCSQTLPFWKSLTVTTFAKIQCPNCNSILKWPGISVQAFSSLVVYYIVILVAVKLFKFGALFDPVSFYVVVSIPGMAIAHLIDVHTTKLFVIEK
jgi:hypothetical protein